MKREPTITQAHPSVHKKNYTQIDNSIIEHIALSPLSKILLIYLISKPENFTFHDRCLRKFMDCGYGKLKSLFRELRDAGYISRVIFQNKEGQFKGSKRIFAATPIYLLENKKSCKNDLISEITESTVYGQSVKPTGPETVLSINNTDLVNNINNNNKQDPAREKAESMDVVVDIKLIGELNKYGINNKTARSWILTYGEEDVRNKYKMLQDEISKGSIRTSRGGWLKTALDGKWIAPDIKNISALEKKEKEYEDYKEKEKLEKERIERRNSPQNTKMYSLLKELGGLKAMINKEKSEDFIKKIANV